MGLLLLLKENGQCVEELLFELFDLVLDDGQVGEEELVEVVVVSVHRMLRLEL